MGAIATAYNTVAGWLAAHGTAAAIGNAALTAAASSAVTKAMSKDDSSDAATPTATTSPAVGQINTNTTSAKRDVARKNALRHGLASTIKAGGLGLGAANTNKATLTGTTKKSLLGE